MNNTGNACPNAGKYKNRCAAGTEGYDEYGGLCAQCYTELDDQGREAIGKARMDLVSPIHHNHHTHLHPPQSRVATTIIAFLAGVMGAAAFHYGIVAMGLLGFSLWKR